jgi:hypothetical protein
MYRSFCCGFRFSRSSLAGQHAEGAARDVRDVVPLLLFGVGGLGHVGVELDVEPVIVVAIVVVGGVGLGVVGAGHARALGGTDAARGLALAARASFGGGLGAASSGATGAAAHDARGGGLAGGAAQGGGVERGLAGEAGGAKGGGGRGQGGEGRGGQRVALGRERRLAQVRGAGARGLAALRVEATRGDGGALLGQGQDGDLACWRRGHGGRLMEEVKMAELGNCDGDATGQLQLQPQVSHRSATHISHSHSHSHSPQHSPQSLATGSPQGRHRVAIGPPQCSHKRPQLLATDGDSKRSEYYATRLQNKPTVVPAGRNERTDSPARRWKRLEEA